MYLRAVLQIHHSNELSQLRDSTRGFHACFSCTHFDLKSFLDEFVLEQDGYY